MLLSLTFVYANGDGESGEGGEPEPVYSVSVSSPEVSAGSWFSVDVNGSFSHPVGAMDITLHYDASVMSVQDEPYAYGWDHYSVNTDTAGEIKLSAISMDGISGYNSLMNISFCTASDASAGNYPLTVTIESARSAAAPFDSVDVSVAPGRVTVVQSAAASVNLSMGMNTSEYSLGDRAVLHVYNYNSETFGAGRIELRYDSNKLRYESLSYKDSLASGAVCDVNAPSPGLVVLTFASQDGVQQWTEMFEANFTVISGGGTYSEFSISGTGFYTIELSALNVSPSTTGFSIRQAEASIPSVRLECPDLPFTHVPFTVRVYLNGAGRLAAGQFTVSYDNNMLYVTTEPAVLSASGQLIVVNPNYNNGTISFSFVDEEGLASEQAVLDITFVSMCDVSNNYISINAQGTVDSTNVQLEMNCIGLQLSQGIWCNYYYGQLYVNNVSQLPEDVILIAAAYDASDRQIDINFITPENSYWYPQGLPAKVKLFAVNSSFVPLCPVWNCNVDSSYMP